MQQPPTVTRTKLGTDTPTLKVGDRAPDFTVKSHDGRDISLAGLRGKRVVLAFFHFAFTNT
ncbi:MAG: redoxin domain-containing protein [Chloroflexi bacterium]|nr:redoxin domain-containing protein [Chloroflexota bacterium]